MGEKLNPGLDVIKLFSVGNQEEKGKNQEFLFLSM